MRRWSLGFLFGLAISAGSLLAQTTTSVASFSSGPRGGTVRVSPRPAVVTPVTGAPYTAQHVTEQVQVGSDGTRFTITSQQETLYRDSQGRTRVERPMMMGGMPGMNPADSPLLVEITDPVANVGYTLDSQKQIAHRYALQPASGSQEWSVPAPAGGGGGARVAQGVISARLAAPAAPANSGVSSTAPPRPEISTEDLGVQAIEGVPAKGSRLIQAWPTGSQGNDRPFQTTSETWYSEELKMMVLTKSVDPRRGENTSKFINIDRTEPPASLFAPPPEYSVVEETGPFSIEWMATPRK
jgi:hypothetical protein